MVSQTGSFTDKARAICVVTQQLGKVISGIGLHAHNLVRHLVEDGQKVFVVAPKDQCARGEIPYEFIAVPPPVGGKSQARWLALSLSFARTLSSMQRREKIDLVHFTDAREALFCHPDAPMIGNVNDTYAADLQSLQYYKQNYSDWLQRWAYYRLVRQCEQRGFPGLQALIANSNYTAKTLQEKYQLPAEQFFVCHKSIDFRHYETASDLRQKIPPHPPRVLFVGGNFQRKGLTTLIKSAPMVLQEIPTVEFWIVGEDKNSLKMQSLCRDLGVEKRFIFMGWRSQEELPKIYVQADVFAMPSLTEAFGVVFLEAMAAGVPVIGTNVGGIPEIIQDCENGLLVEPDDPPELGKAIVRLLKHEDLRERLIQAGLATALRFNIERMMECTYHVYHEVLRSSQNKSESSKH